ncbi:prepilin peptidase [Brevundimonas vesicularis]|uniref:prepilin peptidase n=1 Tax=Brevundimonas vesicularis TaxID=41276 RepID=UPI0038D509A2
MDFQTAILTVTGLVMGSFMGLVSLRLPRGEDIVVRRSHCGSCEMPLRPWHLVPLLSWVALRGRCASCDRRIPLRYPLFEATAASIGLWGGLHNPDLVSALMTAVLGWNLLLIAVVDGEHFWIPDALTIPLFLSGLVAAVLLHPTDLPQALVTPLVGAAAGFTSLWILAFAYKRLRGRDGLGGGDPILFGAIGAWVGWIGLPSVLLYASLSGLSLALARVLLRRKVSGSDALPFGVFLAVGAWLTWLYGPLGLAA